MRRPGLCRVCLKRRRAYEKHRTVGVYNGVLAEAIKSLKYRYRLSIAVKLGRMMATVAMADPDIGNAEAIIPVPMHRVRLRERGMNQSLLLAEELSSELELPVLSGALVRTRYTKQQTTLARKKRRDNVAGAFKVTDIAAIKGKRLLLVDDVTTTGATLEECAKTLTDSGALAVYCLTAAVALTQ
jgi:ComF family protein